MDIKQEPISVKPSLYQIVIQGELSRSWSDWLGDVVFEVKNDSLGKSQTRICGTLPDQAALRGLLTKIWDLNLTIISVVIEEDKSNGGENEY
jgi:hypothetical protein